MVAKCLYVYRKASKSNSHSIKKNTHTCTQERTYSRKRATPANDTYRRKRKKANVCRGIEYQRSEGICLRCRMERHGGFCLDEGKMIGKR
ncbi:hypothetical protein OWV82_005301 [Melia azedarach]|uniref:Uncharacterized protein n=1 Tax=Melia azedarach TaxID=155640 RepID=A0ACC1YSE3_MELAZ|nr:hypothetical protein OWV82_005301 [Melia azedarach]